MINPNFEVAESDFTNNAMKCNCKYDGHRIWVHSCHIGNSLGHSAGLRVEGSDRAAGSHEDEDEDGMVVLAGQGMHCTRVHSPCPLPAGDALSEEANKRFEQYPGQLNNQIS